MPDIGSHDCVNQFRSKAISSFILLDQLHTTFSAANFYSFLSLEPTHCSSINPPPTTEAGSNADEVMEDVDSEEAGKGHRRLTVSFVSITK